MLSIITSVASGPYSLHVKDRTGLEEPDTLKQYHMQFLECLYDIVVKLCCTWCVEGAKLSNDKVKTTAHITKNN